jgi:hypothetical protein
MTQGILRGKHTLLCHAMKMISPRSVGGGEACVVPYMGGNWAPDYVGLIYGPESTNMCFILTDGCQMADICPWESILLTN